MKIVFPYIAQFHQIPHSLPIAIELARRHPDVEVHIAYPGPRYLSFLQRLSDEYAPGVRLHYDCLRLDPVNRRRVRQGRLAWKQLALLINRNYFQDFDAIATPERTSLFLRYLGVDRPRLIWTRHGAGDREVGFSRDVGRFDFTLMAGRRVERRLLDRQLIRPGDYEIGVYAKFDWLQPGLRPALKLFDNDRPTVLYNPHFRGSLSSWPRFGMRVLEQFADSSRYNLIFAPHVRMFDPPRASDYRAFRRFEKLPHLRVDLGSERSIDMSYTRAADLYLGDVSSQVSEFVFRARPCLFLNAQQLAWQNDPSYGFWNLGPVSEKVEGIEDQIDHAFATHASYHERQLQYIDDAFDLNAGVCSAARGADAIVGFLKRYLRAEPLDRRAIKDAADATPIIPEVAALAGKATPVAAFMMSSGEHAHAGATSLLNLAAPSTHEEPWRLEHADIDIAAPLLSVGNALGSSSAGVSGSSNGHLGAR